MDHNKKTESDSAYQKYRLRSRHCRIQHLWSIPHLDHHIFPEDCSRLVLHWVLMRSLDLQNTFLQRAWLGILCSVRLGRTLEAWHVHVSGDVNNPDRWLTGDTVSAIAGRKGIPNLVIRCTQSTSSTASLVVGTDSCATRTVS